MRSERGNRECKRAHRDGPSPRRERQARAGEQQHRGQSSRTSLFDLYGICFSLPRAVNEAGRSTGQSICRWSREPDRPASETAYSGWKLRLRILHPEQVGSELSSDSDAHRHPSGGGITFRFDNHRHTGVSFGPALEQRLRRSLPLPGGSSRIGDRWVDGDRSHRLPFSAHT